MKAKKSALDLSLEQVKKYDPSGFLLCRVRHHGPEGDLELLIKPEQALILSHIGYCDTWGRTLTDAELEIMQSCPDYIWGRPTDPDGKAVVTAMGENSRYDLIGYTDLFGTFSLTRKNK